MKNAMKRIMGLLLVAVLLVSVVPFQALAAEVKGGNDYKGFDSITVYENGAGTQLASQAWADGQDPKTKTITDLLNKVFPSWSSEYTFQHAEYQGTGYTDPSTIFHTNFDSTDVVIYLDKIATHTVTVKYFVDGTNEQRGNAVTFQRKDGTALTFNDVANAAPEKDAYKVDRVTSSNSQVSFGSGESYTVKCDMEFFAYLKGTGSNNGGGNGGSNNDDTSVLTAKYYIDGTRKATKEFDVDAKYINELVDMGGYKSSDYASITSNVDGSDKGTDNALVKRGQSVKIYMTTKTNTPSTEALTAKYYINDSLDDTINYTQYQHKTVRELISLGGYDINAYSSITAKVGSTSKGLDSVIERGETVKIYLTTKSTSSDSDTLTAKYYINNNLDDTINYTQYEHKTVRELISLGGYDIDDYSNVTAKVGDSSKGLNDVIERGETVKIYLTKKTTNNKFPYDVVLNVYLNNSVGEPDKRININDLAADGVISMSEVQNLLTDKYYKAKNSRGIDYDGLYLARGNWVEAFSRDYDKYEKITGVDEMRKESRIDINVMLTNATRKTSSTADSSNPKTGDAIFMTITVMGLSAAALTGLYFYDKKRKAL